MQTLASELRFHMQRLKLNAREIARRSGVHSSFIYDILSGKSSNPSTLRLARVASVLGVSVAQLIPSEGDSAMENGPPTFTYTSTPYLYPPRMRLHAKEGWATERDAPSDNAPIGFSVSWLEARGIRACEPLATCEMRDDAMSPTLLQGDTVLVATTQREPSPPGLFVLSDGSSLLVRRLEFAGLFREGRIRISCDNPCYQSFEQDRDAICILGRVVWYSRALSFAA